jgi:hypothetical protein
VMDSSCLASVPATLPHCDVFSLAGRHVRRLSVDSMEDMPDAVDAQFENDRAAEFGCISSWWTQGSERTPETLMLYEKLPADAEVRYLLDLPCAGEPGSAEVSSDPAPGPGAGSNAQPPRASGGDPGGRSSMNSDQSAAGDTRDA